MSVDDYDTRYRISGLDIRVGGQPMPAAAEMVRMVTVPIAPTRVRLSIGHAAFANEREHRAFHARTAMAVRRAPAAAREQLLWHAQLVAGL